MDIKYKELSSIRTNILNWYPFDAESTILEIGNSCIEITKFLETKCKKIVSIENIEKEINEEFDYILLNNVEEQKYNLSELIKYANNKVKENGVILVITDNKLGLKACNCSNSNIGKKLVTKKEIENCAKQTKFKNIKFYYPLPNYKLTNVIFTDKHVPDEQSILRDLTLYEEDEILAFDERKKFIDLIKEDINLFSVFANSYLVEISNRPDNEIEFVSFGNSRKEQYRMKTIMKSDIVEKYPSNKKAEKHLNQIKLNIEILKKAQINLLDEAKENFIQSKVVRQAKTFDKILINLAKEKKSEEIVEKINDYSKNLEEKFEKSEDITNTIFEKYNITVEKEKKEKLNFIKYGIYDMIFQNAFCVNNEMYFYDQEWIEKDVPFEFIIYRSINYLSNSSEIINRDELYSAIGITDYIKEFEKLEEILQKQIVDETIWSIHAGNHTTIQNLKDTCTHYKNLRNIEIEKNRQKDEEIKLLNETIKTRETEIQYMINSKSWKITQPLRNINQRINKNERKKQ